MQFAIVSAVGRRRGGSRMLTMNDQPGRRCIACMRRIEVIVMAACFVIVRRTEVVVAVLVRFRIRVFTDGSACAGTQMHRPCAIIFGPECAIAFEYHVASHTVLLEASCSGTRNRRAGSLGALKSRTRAGRCRLQSTTLSRSFLYM